MTTHNSPSPLNKTYISALVIVLLSALHIGIVGIFNSNPIVNIAYKLFTENTAITILRILCVIIGLSAVYLIFLTKYHTFLPFLDKTVLPPSVLLLSEQADTNTQISINANNATKVVYWAAQPDNDIVEDNPMTAYDKFENVGIAAVKNNKAILKLKCPAAYQVGNRFKKTLPKHLHYRLIYANGVLSEVHTLKLEKQCNNNNKINKNTNTINNNTNIKDDKLY